MPTVWQILDRRTSMPKVLFVLRAATVPRSTEILPLGFDWVITCFCVLCHGAQPGLVSHQDEPRLRPVLLSGTVPVWDSRLGLPVWDSRLASGTGPSGSRLAHAQTGAPIAWVPWRWGASRVAPLRWVPSVGRGALAGAPSDAGGRWRTRRPARATGAGRTRRTARAALALGCVPRSGLLDFALGYVPRSGRWAWVLLLLSGWVGHYVCYVDGPSSARPRKRHAYSLSTWGGGGWAYCV